MTSIVTEISAGILPLLCENTADLEHRCFAPVQVNAFHDFTNFLSRYPD